METALIIVMVVILFVILLIVKKSNLEQNIRELKILNDSLDFEISEKQKLINQIEKQIDPFEHKEMNIKLDFILNNMNNKSKKNNTYIIFLFILISTLIILYFIYKTTYYIQPDNINNAIKNSLGI